VRVVGRKRLGRPEPDKARGIRYGDGDRLQEYVSAGAHGLAFLEWGEGVFKLAAQLVSNTAVLLRKRLNPQKTIHYMRHLHQSIYVIL
jgi:hypothetical protein